MAPSVSRLQVIAVVMFATVCVSVGEGLLSAGMKQVEKGGFEGLRYLQAAATNGHVVIGTMLMMVFFGLYAKALAWADFSFVLPLTAMSYLFGALFAHFYLGETVTLARWIGTLLIMAGVVVIGRAG